MNNDWGYLTDYERRREQRQYHRKNKDFIARMYDKFLYPKGEIHDKVVRQDMAGCRTEK